MNGPNSLSEGKNAEKSRILFVNTQGRIGGAENSLLLLISHLQKRHRVILACPAGSQLARAAREIGCKCYGLLLGKFHSGCLAGKLYSWVRLGMSIRRISLTVNPDIIHANNSYAMLACLLSAKCRKAKLVWHARDFIKHGLVSRIFGLSCDRIIAVSQSIKHALVAQGVAETKIEVIYNGIDPEPASQCKTMRKQSAAVDSSERSRIIFVNVGQFVPWKKQGIFLDAAVKVLTKMPAARFWLVGDDVFGRNPEYRKLLEENVARKGLSGVVRFNGWAGDMKEVWRSASCLVHTADREPFGRVIIEAMAAGVPVIAANACGPGEIVEDGVSGILVPPNDPESLGSAMLRIAQNPELGERLSSAARRRVTSEFTAEGTMKAVEKVYADIFGDS